jgi:hypothetical protein
MYLILIGWLYVVLMVAVVEATSSGGTLLGAAITFLMWGLLPMSIVAYLMGTPRAASAAGLAGLEPDGGDHSAGDTVAPVRKEP